MYPPAEWPRSIPWSRFGTNKRRTLLQDIRRPYTLIKLVGGFVDVQESSETKSVEREFFSGRNFMNRHPSVVQQDCPYRWPKRPLPGSTKVPRGSRFQREKTIPSQSSSALLVLPERRAPEG